MINLILERDTYMEFPKSIFLRRLGRAFEILGANSDDQLFETHTTHFRKRNKRYILREIEFVENHSSLRISFVSVARNGKIYKMTENTNKLKNVL
jgi:hypothetical protein